MPSPPPLSAPSPTLDTRAFPTPVTELCAYLEERGIAAWLHGDGLLDALCAPAAAAWGRDRQPTHALLCEGTGEDLLRALPHAVVTTAHQARLTQATKWGPVDLIPLGEASIASGLAHFGCSALAVAYRPANQSWAEVEGALAHTQSGVLDLAVGGAESTLETENVFAAAPRRYWIAARLIAEYGLAPSDALLAAARRAFPEISEVLPLGASARRMVDRVLASANPGPALSFLRESGVTPAVFPGAAQENERLIGSLPPVAPIRWAAWLRGSATGRGLVRLRVPHALARRVERVQEAHPLDRAVPSLREASIRRVLNRLEADELDALFVWRRLELASENRGGSPAEAQRAEERLAGLERRVAETRAGLARTGTVRTLALDGAGIMETLKIGPGRHIGLALSHLASFIETHPEENERSALEEELRDWASRNPEKIS